MTVSQRAVKLGFRRFAAFLLDELDKEAVAAAIPTGRYMQRMVNITDQMHEELQVGTRLELVLLTTLDGTEKFDDSSEGGIRIGPQRIIFCRIGLNSQVDEMPRHGLRNSVRATLSGHSAASAMASATSAFVLSTPRMSATFSRAAGVSSAAAIRPTV